MTEMVQQQAEKSEYELIEDAQTAVGTCNWTVGETATRWLQYYAAGRSLQEFAIEIGWGVARVQDCVAVFQQYEHLRDNYPNLKWSHFNVAKAWDDEAEILQWANEQEATVPEMRAWRRVQGGKDTEGDGNGWGWDDATPSDVSPVDQILSSDVEEEEDTYTPFKAGASEPQPEMPAPETEAEEKARHEQEDRERDEQSRPNTTKHSEETKKRTGDGGGPAISPDSNHNGVDQETGGVAAGTPDSEQIERGELSTADIPLVDRLSFAVRELADIIESVNEIPYETRLAAWSKLSHLAACMEPEERAREPLDGQQDLF